MLKNIEGKHLILLVLPFLFFFSMTLVSGASDDRVIIKQVTEFDLTRPCFNDGAFCSSAAICNITISRPDGTILINNSRMTNQISYHNKTLSKSQTSNPGNHEAIMSCTDGTESGADTFDILVSPSGSDDNSLGSLLLLAFGFLFSIGIITIGFNKNDPIIVLFGGMGLFVFGLYTLLSGVGNYRNTLTEGTSLIVLGIAGYISIRTGMEMIND